jgi:HEAT repeat protein
VWRSALAAVATDSRDGAIRIATMALEHASADVRREACQNLAAHGDPRHAPLLLKALDDSDATVVLAAVRALGAVGTLDDKQPLVLLLDGPDQQLRLEAAISLARLRAEQGTVVLERLTQDTDSQVRLRAAQAMGEIADPLFLPALMAMLGDQADVRRVAMIGLARTAGTDVAATQGGRPLSDEEKVDRWHFWYRQHQAPTMTARRP